MGEFDAFAAGMTLLAGGGGPSWEARSGRVRALMQRVADGIEKVPGFPPKPAPPPPPVSPRPPRRELEKKAREVFEAVSTRRPAGLAALMSEQVWMLWPRGELVQHPRDELISALKKAKGRASPAPIAKVKSYTYAELRSVVARGVAEMIDAVLGLRGGLLVSFFVRSRHTPPGRQFVLFAPDLDGQWRARCLPLPAPDDCHLAGTRTLKADDAELWGAEEVVRRVVLGQPRQLSSQRPLLAPKVWVRGEWLDVEGLIREAGSGEHRLENADMVLMGSQSAPLRLFPEAAGKKQADAIKAACPDTFGRPFARLAPKLCATRLGLLDPGANESQPAAEAFCLLLQLEDEAGVRRHRVAAILL